MRKTTVLPLAVLLVLSLFIATLPDITTVKYPFSAFAQNQPPQSPTPTSQTQCIDFNMDKVCESMILANGTMISNPALGAEPTSSTNTRQAIDFVPYQNPTLGIMTHYPSDWHLGEVDNDEVSFVQQKDIVYLEARVDDVDSTLSQYTNTRLNELREQHQDFKLIESTPTTISGNLHRK